MLICMVWIHGLYIATEACKDKGQDASRQQVLLSLMPKFAVLKVTSNDVQDVTDSPKYVGPDASTQQILLSVMLKSATSKIIFMVCRM